jgi:hypothetical protein
MEKTDRILSDLLKKNMHKIEDELFTKRIINMHLSLQKKTVYKPFPNFSLLIIGISSVIISIGLIFSLKIKIVLFEGFVFTEQYGLILLLISLIFLISTWIENFITPKKRASSNI